MRIEEPLGLFPKGFLLLPAIIGDFFDGRRLIDAFSVLEYRYEDLAHDIGAACKLRLLPGLDGIKQEQVFTGVEGLVGEADEVCFNFSCCFIIDPKDRFVTRIGDFLRIFGNLYLWNEFAGFVLDGGELVHPAEGRIVLGGDQVRPHTPGVNGCSLYLEIVEQIPDRWTHR